MAITFPISLPSVGDIVNLKFTMLDATGVGESPYTFSQETYEHAGKRWGVEVSLAPMSRAYAEEWVAFLASLKGRRGTFLMGDRSGATARGALGGTPLVKGAGQTGGTLLIDGCTAGVTNWIRKGDWVQLGTSSSSRLHKSLTDANSDGSGNATLELWPGPRTAPGDNDAVIVANTVSCWRLISNQRGYDIGGAGIYGMSFAAVEAL